MLELDDDLDVNMVQELNKHGTNAHRKAFAHALLVLETIHISLFLAIYLGSCIFAPDVRVHRKSTHDLDSYFDLAAFDTIKNFHGDAHLMENTAESAALFNKIEATDGVVAIDTTWAMAHNLAPSLPHPYNASKSIYQIDMFHSLHCIFRLRNKLISQSSLEAWPRNDTHTLHCLDYLRLQIMCHADLTLQGTDDLIHFNKSNGHVCRSSDAVADWARSWHWQGYRRYLLETTGFS